MSSYSKGRLVSLAGIRKNSLCQLSVMGRLRFHYVASLFDYAGPRWEEKHAEYRAQRKMANPD